MLASMDIKGTVLIRNIKNLQEAETVLHNITSIPKELDSFVKILFNAEKPGDEKVLIVIINE